jgi:hypothetical protein
MRTATMISKAQDTLSFEAIESQGAVDEWRVEAINHAGDGEVYVALFSGPMAQERALEYAEWKNAGNGIYLG